jgi:heme O synthase-like polyprenyltransferase
MFALDSMIPNGIFTYAAWQFYRNPTREGARKVFRYSLLVLPALMILMNVHKKQPNQDTESSIEELLQ